MKPSTFSDHTIPQSTGPHIPCVHSCDCIFHILCTNIDSINNGQARAHSPMQWTSHRCLSNQLWGLACKQPCLQPRPDQPLDTYHLFFPIKYFSFVSHYLFWYFFLLFLGTCLQTTLHLTKVRSSRSACNQGQLNLQWSTFYIYHMVEHKQWER